MADSSRVTDWKESPSCFRIAPRILQRRTRSIRGTSIQPFKGCKEKLAE